MNVGRGLFRAWILLTVLWVIGAGTLAYFIIPEEVSGGKWVYIPQLKVPLEQIDPSRPIDEIERSPSAEKLAVTFQEVGDQYDLDEAVKLGHLRLVEMPDNSSLYLNTYVTEEDQQYLTKAFWDQRWWRYASLAKVWAPILVVPPIILFILGWVILWVCRGFKAAGQSL
jgi:hypothetical protein